MLGLGLGQFKYEVNLEMQWCMHQVTVATRCNFDLLHCPLRRRFVHLMPTFAIAATEDACLQLSANKQAVVENHLGNVTREHQSSGRGNNI